MPNALLRHNRKHAHCAIQVREFRARTHNRALDLRYCAIRSHIAQFFSTVAYGDCDIGDTDHVAYGLILNAHQKVPCAKAKETKYTFLFHG